MADARPPGIPIPDIPTAHHLRPATPTLTQDLRRPTALFGDRYRIERVIGEGAFGRVYLAFDGRLRRNVAIKELLASRHSTDPATYQRYVQRFEREARATSVIQHPNAVTAYDLHVDAEGNNYLVLEYVDGTNLRDLLTQVGTLPVSRAVAITRDMASALEAVHEQEIVHRDVKPANIMITRRGVAKLMDFGIAQVGHESLRTQITAGHPGTPLYMSPEQSSGYGYIDGRSDLYALGLVLYEMLVGEPYGRKRQAIGTARPDLPPPLVAIVDRMMAQESHERYQNASDVLRDLGRLERVAPRAAAAAAPPGSPAPGADAPRTPGRQTGAGSTVTAPVPGVPSATGGPASQLPPGAPIYSASAPPTTVSFAPPPVYPAAPVSTPPSDPPRRGGNRGLIIGIGGVALAAIVVIAGVFIAMSQSGNGNKVATATPILATLAPTSGATTRPTTISTTQSTAAATTSATAGSTPRLTTPVITGSTQPGPTRAASSSVSIPSVGRTTFTDPKNLIRLQYPRDWKATRAQNDNTNALELDGPDGVIFWLYINDPQQGSLQDEMDIVRMNQDGATDFMYTDRTQTDLTIAGEPAKALTYNFAAKSDATNKGPGQWWVVNHGGRQFSFRANFPGSHQAELNGIIASVTFSTNGAFPLTTTWTDPKGLVRLQYPSGWSITSDPEVSTNVLEFDGPDGTYFFVDIYDPQTGTNIANQVQGIMDVHAKSTKFIYVDGAVSDAKVGNEAAKTFPFTYTAKDKANAPTFNGQIWDLNHGGKEFLLTSNANSTHKAEIDAIVASITFLQ